MKILIVSDGIYPYSMGGSHRLIYELIIELIKNGHYVTCVIPEIDKDSHMYHSNINILKLENLNIVQFYINKKNIFTKIKSFFFGFKVPVEKLLTQENFDFINIQYFPALFSLRNLRHIPFSYLFHGPWSSEFRSSLSGRADRYSPLIKFLSNNIFLPLIFWPSYLLERHLLSSRCQTFMVLSNYMKQTLINKFNIRESIIKINPSGINFDNFHRDFDHELRKSLVNEKKYLFITIRRLEKRMGLDNLILACKELKRSTNDFMLIIGGNGHQYEYLKYLINNSECADNIKLMGFIPEDLIAKYLSSSDLFILPSRELEGFGLVVLESMACGTPVLTSPYGGAPEVVSQFDKDLVLKSLDATVVSKKLYSLITSGYLDKTKSIEAQEFVRVNYSWNKFMVNYIYWLSNNN